MHATSERRRQVTAHIERAKQHADELRMLLEQYFLGAPFKVAFRRDPDTRRIVYYVESLQQPPLPLAPILADALQNLVTGLDHLAYQLVCSDTADNPPNPRAIYFPIASDATAYEKSKHQKLAGASVATVAAVDAIQPYRGGSRVLWKLQQLNNIAKHRLLLTVAAGFGGVNIGQVAARHMEGQLPAAFLDMLRNGPFIREKGLNYPLTVGYELYMSGPDEEPDPDQQFNFEVVIHEPGIAEGEHVLTVVAECTTEVERVCAELSSLL